MSMKELDRLAKQNQPMPNALISYQQAYYVASRGLYQQYAKGEITLEQARTEKEQVIEAYKSAEWEWNYFIELHRVMDKLKQLKEEGFNTVLELEVLEILEEITK